MRRQRAKLRDNEQGRFDFVRVASRPQHTPELAERLRVGQRAMAALAREREALDERIQAVVRLVRVQPPRQLQGACDTARELASGTPELAAEEPVVEARVVGDEEPAFE